MFKCHYYQIAKLFTGADVNHDNRCDLALNVFLLSTTGVSISAIHILSLLNDFVSTA